jgi:hypothetical protein
MNAAEQRPTQQPLAGLIRVWQEEHQELIQKIRQTTLWLGELARQAEPRFGELGEHLTRFRQSMLDHFHRESTLADTLFETYGCVEADSNRRRAADDHVHLSRRIDDLVGRLRDDGAGFASFQDAIHQVGIFVDAVEQHEEEEAEGLQWLGSPCAEPRPAAEF